MPGTEDLKEFVENRLLAYDPDIDLTEGSPAQTQVVDPVVNRYAVDPLEMDIEKFIDARLAQEYPDLNIREGSGVRDTLVKPSQILMDPVVRETNLIKQGQSLANPDLLSDTEADALVANLFVTRVTGGLSTGTVRLYFNAPVAVNISVGNICYTASGLRYLPTTLQSISAEAMIFNQSGNLYYFDIQVTAEKAGSEYNIDKEEIVGITNLNTAVRVTNPERFENGLDEETTDELVEKAEISITERSLVTGRGVAARLFDQFEDLKHLQVVGFQDEEMGRDVIKGGDLGEVLLSGTDGYTEDDGDGDSLTPYFRARYADFTAFFGATGATENYWLTVSQATYGTDCSVPVGALDHLIIPGAGFSNDDVGNMIVTIDATNPGNIGVAEILGITSEIEVRIDRTGVQETGITYLILRPDQDFEISEALSSTELRVDGELSVDKPALLWSIRQKSLTLSDIPGGILFSLNGDIEIQSDEIHIGGASDFYVRGTGVEETSLIISAISDEEPVLNALTGETDTTSGYEEFFRDQTKNFVAEGVEPGMSLVIEAGVDAGTKTILRVGTKPFPAAIGTETQWLQVDPAITSTAANLRYKIVDEIDIDLNEPKTRRGEGTDAQTLQLGDVITTTSAVDFLSLGTEVDDTLRLLDGDDAGEYTVIGTSGTGNKNLQVSAQMVSTANNISWELYKAQEGIDLPLVRIRSVDILDSSEQPTGDTVPYATPVDARSTTFSNAGRGIKVSTGDAITGIVATTALDDLSFPLGAGQLDFSINAGVTQSVDITGSTGSVDLINKINAVIPNIGGSISVDGKDYLTVRSADRWVQLLARPDNVVAGLDAAGGDNRQIKSAGNISDWSSPAYDLKAAKDLVSITTGTNIGHLYLVAVETDRILAVGFDEAERRLRFLDPGASVSLTAGSRSYGNARVYFLDPTSFEARGSWYPPLRNTLDVPSNQAIAAAGETIAADQQDVAWFTATINGASLRFFPDPDLNYSVLPATSDDPPNNLLTNVTSPNLVVTEDTPSVDLGKGSRDAEIDFLTREIRVGDLLDINYQPLQGTVDLTTAGGFTYGTGVGDDIPSSPRKTFTLAVDGAPPKTLTFSDQIADEDDLVDEINDFWGLDIAFLEDIAGAKYLRLEADVEFTLYAGDPNAANATLGLPIVTTNNNAIAAVDGYHTITYVGDTTDPTNHNALEITPAHTHSAGDKPAQHFQILRPGVQRLHSTDMAENTELGLYYMDVELVSDGSGDNFNIGADEILELEGYASDGYQLVVADSDRSFSTEEEIKMVVSRRILTVGSSDRPDQALTLSSQNLQVNYDRSPLVASVQAFASADLERVLCASLLVRHLQPHYLNFDLVYRGGSSADVVEDDINEYLDDLEPDDRVESSDVQNVARRRGADYVQNPISLVAVAHDADRKITVDRSEDYVSTGRLATFFPDNVTVTRDIPDSF